MASRRFRPAVLVSCIWIAPAVLNMAQHVAQNRLQGEPPPQLHDLLFGGADWLVYALLTPPIFAVSRRWPIARPLVGRRVVVHLAFALISCAAWAVAGKMIQLGIGLLIDARALEQGLTPRDWVSWILVTLPFGVVVYACVAGMAHAVRYFEEASEREVQVARLSEQLAGARFAALEAQVNPHFLFNTLNTIAVRARDGDTPGTVRMVEQLSELLRRTLTRHQTSEVALGEEIDLVRQYLAIEQARFSDRLRPDFRIDAGALNGAVPSFAVQHLVENAIRHGIARRTGSGLLTVTARRDGDFLHITVEDDGAGVRDGVPAPDGRGLSNTMARLESLYGGHATLQITARPGGGTMAVMRVPWREVSSDR